MGGGLSLPPTSACLHGFGQLKLPCTELDMLLLDDRPVSLGLVARVSITKRKAPSFFSKRNTTKEDGLWFSRGSSLLVKIEREESVEKEQLKQKVWSEIAERKASQQKSRVSSSIVDASASRTLPNNDVSSKKVTSNEDGVVKKWRRIYQSVEEMMVVPFKNLHYIQIESNCKR